MITLKTIMILGLISPIDASNVDDEIIKNLDFFQNMDLLKNEMPFAYNNVKDLKTINDQIIINSDTQLKIIDTTPEKK